MKQFESMTIAQLRKLTEQFERLQLENVKFKAKFPTKLNHFPTAEEIIKSLEEGKK